MKDHGGRKEADQAEGEEVCSCCSSLVGQLGDRVKDWMAPRCCSHCRSIVRCRDGIEVAGIAVGIAAVVGLQRRSEAAFAVLTVAGRDCSPMRRERAVVEARSCRVHSLVVEVSGMVHSGLQRDAVFEIGHWVVYEVPGQAESSEAIGLAPARHNHSRCRRTCFVVAPLVVQAEV